MSRQEKWTEDQIEFLKQNFNSDYNRLVQLTGRTRRALKLKIEEISILKENRSLTSKEFVVKGLLKRSVFQIAMRLKKIRGTARREFTIGWDAPSNEFAYFIGIICSDGYIDKYVLQITQLGNKEVLDRIECFLKSTGMNVVTTETVLRKDFHG